MNNEWGLSVGQIVEWETSGHGSIQRKGEVIAYVPAGVPISSVSSIDLAKTGRGIVPCAQIDRYAVKVPRLNRQGDPVKTGAIEIKLPNRWLLEKALGIKAKD